MGPTVVGKQQCFPLGLLQLPVSLGRPRNEEAVGHPRRAIALAADGEALLAHDALRTGTFSPNQRASLFS